MAAERDVVIIGAGHNGLVAANYLAKAGLRVLVVERSDRVGGACVTDEIAPGFKVSAAAYVSGLFRPQIIEDLELAKFGLRQVAFDPQGFCPFPLAHNLLGNIDGQVGGWGLVLGGMGALPDALAAAARARGVEILLRSPVERVRVRGGRAVGVRLEGGRTIDAKAVVSTADPKRTFLQLVEPDDVPAEFRRSVAAIKMHGAAMKVNCALSELPRWAAADQTPGPHHRGSTYIGPSIEYVEDSFFFQAEDGIRDYKVTGVQTCALPI